MSSKAARNKKNTQQAAELDTSVPDVKKRSLKPISPLNEAQANLIQAIFNNDIIFVSGPAGTGKTWLAAALAAQELEAKRIASIVVTRPVVEVAGEEIGFLPGELEEKFAPWFDPFRDVLEERLGTGPLEYHLKRKNIEAKPLAFMRGKSYRDRWVILDEAQNTTVSQMKMLLTRLGKGSKMIILGDVKQSDIKCVSGLQDAIKRLGGLPRVYHHEFTRADVVRHDLVAKILERYED